MIIDYPILFILTLVLVIASFIDIRSLRIPNWLTYSSLAWGIFYFSILKGYEGFFYSFSGAATGVALLMIPYLIGGTGAGDVKLIGAVGSFLGSKGVFSVFMVSSILAGFYALILIASRGLLIGTFKRYGIILKRFIITQQFIYIPPNKKEKELKIRYGLAIALGTFLYLGFWV
jgi:prepilin peptidase CpaA